MDPTSKRKATGAADEPSPHPEKKKASQGASVDSAAGTVVGHQYEIVRRIIAQLPAADVKRCSAVSRLWKAAADAEVLKSAIRLRPEAFRWEGVKEEGIDGRSFGFDWRRKLENEGWRLEHRGRVYYEAKVPQLKSFHQHLESFVETEMMVDPLAAICFSVGNDDAFVNGHNFNLDQPTMAGILPKGCLVLQASSGGIFNGDRGVGLVDSETGQFMPSVAIMLLPKLPTVRMVPFEVREGARWTTSNAPLAALNRCTTAGGHLTDKDVIKCTIIMSNHKVQGWKAFMFLNALLRATNGNVAIGGSTVQFVGSSTGIKSCKHVEELIDDIEDDEDVGSLATSVGMMFVVPKDDDGALSAYSIVLPEEADSEEKVTRHLQQLKDAVSLDGGTSSCAFMFASYAPMDDFLLGMDDFELRSFKRLFPTTPVVGLFGNEGIGKTHLRPSAGAGASNAKKWLERDVHIAFCTVFVFLSFKT